LALTKTQLSATFSVAVKRGWPNPFLISILFLLYYWTCSHPEFSWNTARWTLNKNQSITFNCKGCIQIRIDIFFLY
jgi:hypothetical protein